MSRQSAPATRARQSSNSVVRGMVGGWPGLDSVPSPAQEEYGRGRGGLQQHRHRRGRGGQAASATGGGRARREHDGSGGLAYPRAGPAGLANGCNSHCCTHLDCRWAGAMCVRCGQEWGDTEWRRGRLLVAFMRTWSQIYPTRISCVKRHAALLAAGLWMRGPQSALATARRSSQRLDAHTPPRHQLRGRPNAMHSPARVVSAARCCAALSLPPGREGNLPGAAVVCLLHAVVSLVGNQPISTAGHHSLVSAWRAPLRQATLGQAAAIPAAAD